MASKPLTRSEQKKRDIIEAAKVVFKRDGVQATSMDKLAEAANVSKRTVYNHFDTKEALVMYLVKELWEKALSGIQITYISDTPLAKQLTDILSEEVALMSDPEYVDLTRVAVGHFFYKPEVLQQEAENMSKQETTLFKWLKAATEDGKLNISDIDFANHQLHSLIKGSCFWPQMMCLSQPLTTAEQKALVSECVEMFLSRYVKS